MGKKRAIAMCYCLRCQQKIVCVEVKADRINTTWIRASMYMRGLGCPFPVVSETHQSKVWSSLNFPFARK